MDTTLSGMLGSIRFLRVRQFRWTAVYWLRAFGLVPNSGKWTERITFIYIYVLAIGLLTPTFASLLNGLYVLETKVPDGIRYQTLWNTLPILIAFASIVMVALPWRAWMMRFTFGDIMYLTPTPFDRRVLAVWRFLEVIVFIGLIGFFPFTLLAPIFGSIQAVQVIAAVLRGVIALWLWFIPMIAAGWVISMQEYIPGAPSSLIRFLTRGAIVVGAFALFVYGSDVLFWPGRLVLLLASGAPEAIFGWLILLAWASLGVTAIAFVGRKLSLTKATEHAETLARLQQLGFMIVVDRQVLGSILAETRAGQSYPVGVIPRSNGVLTIAARQAVFYRRQYGQALQLIAIGVAFGLGLVIWRPYDIFLTVSTAVLLILALPTMLSRVFRHDLDVPFIWQFNLHPLVAQLVTASLVPTLLIAVGMLPAVLAMLPYLPPSAFALIPIPWVLTLFGHVEGVGKGGRPAARSIFTVILGTAALVLLAWNSMQIGRDPFLAAVSGAGIAAVLSFVLLFIAEARRVGTAIPQSE